MVAPKFFVVARVVGRDGALPLWKERLVHLCNASATETLGDSYYWGQDLDGEPDTLWGLEGYTHPAGFFLGHVSTDIFKREMALVDSDRLLRNEQGLASRDYNLHHYDWAGGWLKRADDPDYASKSLNGALQSFGILKEVRDEKMLTLWVRTPEEFDALKSSKKFQDLMSVAKAKSDKTEIHLSRAFNGHLDLNSSTIR
ncbi:hypothetical protein N7481_005040 [Penicillium waksmanii]|uniref:uncharacterized protein n=1 Tax=Penicillium waksmanii TaxID=69791 RepID=UPI00254761B2|nr:uncharacterized protein N7481_005040 [Penicillium waksmanii]KAJ5982941.1 hypothetical protein N7481_005040 [Penicillium waksmanii]